MVARRELIFTKNNSVVSIVPDNILCCYHTLHQYLDFFLKHFTQLPKVAMKREADGDMGSPQKRSRRLDEEVRLLIPSKVAGSIIGKGGQNITKLRSQYKASITVPDCPGPERMLTLSSDLDTICNIVTDVVPKLEENGGRVNGNELDLRMMIHQSQAGCVIGKAGYKIKELREKTGARIKIFSTVAPQSTDRIIQIIGEQSKCVDSIREIISLVKSNPIKGIVNPYDPHNYDDFYAEEYGGWGSSAGGNERRNGGGAAGGGGTATGNASGGGNIAPRPPAPNRNGFRDGPPPARFNNRGAPTTLRSSGGPPSDYNERGSQRGGYATNGNSSLGSRSLNGTSPSPFERNDWGVSPNNAPALLNHSPSNMVAVNGVSPNYSSGLGSQNGGLNTNKTTTQVTIPKDLAGAIIGKGGGRIRKIRQDSGAGITIDEPLPGSNDRIITITGLPNQIQMAQYLLQQSVHNNSERNSY